MSTNKVNWNGLLKVIEIQHLNVNGDILWSQKNIHNVLHLDGEEFLLRAAFQGGQVNTIIPEYYYVGMDNRVSVSALDDMDGLINEPQVNGYVRQPVSSTTDFTLNFEQDHYVASSPIMTFQATGGDWGPVKNIFLTDRIDNTGYLIATATLSSEVTVTDGDSITARIGLQLRDCADCESE